MALWGICFNNEDVGAWAVKELVMFFSSETQLIT